MPDLSPERAVAAFDSASAMVRATARALVGRDFAHLGRGVFRAAPVRASALLPTRARQRAYALLGGNEGVAPARLGDVDMEAAASWVVDHYPGQSYPGAVVGSSNGAAVHLCAATGMPLLPQTLLVPVHWPENDPDRPDAAMAFGRRVAPPLLARNPGVVLHHMHDGNQDRLMVDQMTYFRLKWATLPQAYARFLSEQLAPGAPVIVLADDSTWPTTRVDERHVFQTGAQGGLTPQEYLRGSPRVARFLKSQGSTHSRFVAPESDGTSPEAEWGFEQSLEASITAEAAASGHPLVTLRIGAPQELSAPVAEMARARIRANGGSGDRLLVESFAMLDPVQALRVGAVPYWSFFSVEPALLGVEAYVRARAAAGDGYRDLIALLFPHGVPSAGSASPRAWARLGQYTGTRVRFAPGTVPRWPAHFDALARYGPALRRLPTVLPSVPALEVPDALHLLEQAGTRIERQHDSCVIDGSPG